MRKFLECGDLKHGFARVRCPKCHEEETQARGPPAADISLMS